MAQIYFDADDLARGRFAEVSDVVQANNGLRFEIGEWLARGGNGAVYACRDRATGDDFAIKFLINRGVAITRRFQREARLMSTLSHEHIVRLVADGATPRLNDRGRIPFIIMERADTDLAALMADHGRNLGPEAYIGQVRGLSQALAEMHRHAIHRDIKPENILVLGDRWLLGDYGLCRFLEGHQEDDISGDRLIQGPRFWLSPEVQNSRLGNADRITPGSDVYQLAAVFWFVATGRHPSGILGREDWRGPDWLYPPISAALQHGLDRRPDDGAALAATIEAAVAAA